MTGHAGNSEFLFPINLNVSFVFASGHIEGLGGTKLTVSLVASHSMLNVLWLGFS